MLDSPGTEPGFDQARQAMELLICSADCPCTRARSDADCNYYRQAVRLLLELREIVPRATAAGKLLRTIGRFTGYTPYHTLDAYQREVLKAICRSFVNGQLEVGQAEKEFVRAGFRPIPIGITTGIDPSDI